MQGNNEQIRSVNARLCDHNGIGLKVIQPGEKVTYEVKFELLR
jgi:hypothetical protein